MTGTLIQPDTLAELITDGQTVTIDTRSPEEYAAGHIPGAVNIREIFTYLATSDPAGLDTLKETFTQLFGAAGLSGAETAVIYEDALNTGFGQSCRGYFLLQSLGYPEVRILDGGFQAWLAADLPVDTETPAPAPAAFPLNAEPTSLMLTKEQMLASLEDPSISILDVRDRDEWEGLSSSPYGVDFCPRKGRLPGAVWVEWYNLMETPEGGVPQFRSPEAIRAACAEVGITPESTVHVYCFKGARASNTFVALHEAGIRNVKIYFGSWNEWSRDPSLPIEEGTPSMAAA